MFFQICAKSGILNYLQKEDRNRMLSLDSPLPCHQSRQQKISRSEKNDRLLDSEGENRELEGVACGPEPQKALKGSRNFRRMSETPTTTTSQKSIAIHFPICIAIRLQFVLQCFWCA